MTPRRVLGMIPAFICLPHHIVYGTALLIVAYDHFGFVVGLARMRVCTFMCVCVYAHATCRHQHIDEDRQLNPDSKQHQP